MIPSYQDYHRLEEIRNELLEMLKREESRHIMDSYPAYEAVLEEAIQVLDNYIDYDPTTDEPGEPPLTAAEMHSAAWKEHQEAHR